MTATEANKLALQFKTAKQAPHLERLKSELEQGIQTSVKLGFFSTRASCDISVDESNPIFDDFKNRGFKVARDDIPGLEYGWVLHW